MEIFHINGYNPIYFIRICWLPRKIFALCNANRKQWNDCCNWIFRRPVQAFEKKSAHVPFLKMTKIQHPRPGNSNEALTTRRHFVRQSGVAIASTIFLTSCDGLWDKIIPSKKDKRDKTLAFFGDSLTIGTGGTVPYGKWVGDAFPERLVVNDGINGQIALSIAIRQGGVPVKISIAGAQFKGTEPVKITKLSNEFLSTPINTNVYTRTGTLAGVRCTVTRKASPEQGEVYSVEPVLESVAEVPDNSIFELDDPIPLRTATQILWYGRNNIGQARSQDDILSAIASSVDYIATPRRYLILGILLATPENKGTANYDQVISINNRLAALYGEAFVPMTPPTASEMKEIGYEPGAQDQQDIDKMNWPRGLRPADRSDEIHLNDKGYQIVANRVVRKIKDLEY